MKTIKKLECDKACNMGNVDKTPVRVEGRTVKRAAAIQKDAVKSVQKNATKEVKRVPVGEKLVTKEVVKEKK